MTDELMFILQDVKYQDITIVEGLHKVATLLEDFALMNQDDLDRGKGFVLLMNLVKQLRDE